jgi:bcr-type benzoyl-CoA reductase subunit C
MDERMILMKDLLNDPYIEAREEKRGGRKVVGITPMYFPEELVHASGALPVIMQESTEPVTFGFGHIYPFYCGFTRSNIDLAVKGKQDIFDAIVVSDICLQTRYMAHIMKRNMPKVPFTYMQWPLEAKPERWLSVTMERLQKCRKSIEKALNTEIDDSSISRSITLYNRYRALLRKVHEIRMKKPGAITAKEVMLLTLSGMVSPKEKTVKFLEEIIPELERREARVDGRIKVFLSGHLCQAVKGDILDLIEDTGANVTGDDIYTGFRYAGTDVRTDLPVIEALARWYMEQTVPCPTRSEHRKEWANYIVERVKETDSKGVVFLVVKFCEAEMIYYPYLKKILSGAGIPHIMIETEHEVVSLEGIRTRLQAFVEMLKG